MKKILAFILLLSTVALFAGCSQNNQSDGPAVAKIGKDTITEDDFIRELGRVPEWARSQFRGMEGKEKFLDELIKRDLIYQDAKRMRLDKDKEYLAKIREFEKMSLVSLILKKEVEDKAKVSDAEVKAFFDQNKDKFTIGTKIRASHILVKTEKEANDILARINKGESFSKLARALSQDKSSAEKGGDLGYFGRGKMVPEFERAALALKPGEVSKPVKTRFGYHIIKLTDIKKGKLANFEQSKESIRRQLAAQKRKALFNSYIEKLKEKTEITKNKDILASIRLPWEKTEDKTPQPPAEQSKTEKEKQPETK